jgi:transcriptional regulator with XRE-family HTH domain
MSTDPTRTDLGQSIAARRQELGLTQSQLGEEAGLDQTVISRIESGQRGLDALELVSLARALEIEVTDLLRSHASAQRPEVLAYRLRQQDPTVAEALSWVDRFIANLDWLESEVSDV